MLRKVSSGVSNHVVIQKRRIRKLKNWHKSVFLFFLLIVYLIIGALIFCTIEGEPQREAQLNLNNYSLMFLEEHSTCLNVSDLRVYVDLILQAMNDGAILSKEFDTPTNKEDGSLKELWNLPNAFFFSSTVVTTIGYGNLAPRTSLGRILCICYALVGIPMTGWMLSSIGQTFHDKWQSIGRIIRKLTHRTRWKSFNNIVHVLFVFFLAYSTIIIVPAIIIGYAEGWSYLDAHYFCFISLTTIGFGDLSPMSWMDADSIFKQWLYTVLYVTYLLLGLSLLSVALTAFLRKQEGRIRSAKERVKNFVRESARNATTLVKEAAERSTPGNTPGNSVRKRGQEADAHDDPSEFPRLLKVTPISNSLQDSNLPQWTGIGLLEMTKDDDTNLADDNAFTTDLIEERNDSERLVALEEESIKKAKNTLSTDKEHPSSPDQPENMHEYDIINSSDIDREDGTPTSRKEVVDDYPDDHRRMKEAV